MHLPIPQLFGSECLAGWLRSLAASMLLMAGAFSASAQCSQVGWVASTTPGCGAKIIDLNTGALLKAVAGADHLVAGKTIRYSSHPTALPPGCTADGLSVIALTCISDTLPCVADFGHSVSQQNAYRLSFDADIYDPSVQFCSWTFGDGATATGHQVQHTFPHEGYFTVCLTVKDAYGCSIKKCRNVYVSDQNPNWCGYDVEITAVGTKLFGKLRPVVGDPGVIKSVKWFDNKTNTILAETPEFTATLPGNGTYYICAQYDIASPDDNSICTTTRCQVLTVAPASCVNLSLVNVHTICPSFFTPVCACNGVTYINECEAMAAGVSKWWIGECGMPTPGSCGSDMDFEIMDGNPTTGYQVRFKNLSSGNYSNVQLDFGDGSPIWQGGPGDTIIDHHYTHGGIFKTNLSVWKTNNCVSSVSKLLVTDAINMSADKMPATSDYVLPGDANGDFKANVYDLLHLGLGFYTTGAPRPFATSAWTPQFAPNWMQSTPSGLNFKHIDCDGNGLINDFDRNAIEQHYSPIDTGIIVCGPNSPKLWLQFAADTLIVDPNASAPLEISADIMVGSSTQPVFDLYGLAFALRYPEYVNHNPEVLYSSNSFFGSLSDILLLPKDNYDQKQFDLGFSRKYGQPISGHGSIAKISFSTDFIIIIDIIDRTESLVIPFVVPVHGLQAIDAAGNTIEIQGAVQDTLWLNVLETTATRQRLLERQTLAYPNPASTDVYLVTGTPTMETVDVYDAVGRLIEQHTPASEHRTRLNTSTWSKGMYIIQVRTNRGVVSKRLLVN